MNFWSLIGVASILIGVTRGTQLSYDELVSLRIQCDPFDTCNTTKENIKAPLRSCECDNSCAFYGDCCIDAPKRHLMEGRKPSAVCLKVNDVQGYYVVSTCKSNWRELETKRKCERNPSDEDPYTLIPATSRRSNVTYKNRYCARCNEGNADLDFWKIGVECSRSDHNTNYDFQNDLIYNSRLRTWGVRLPNQTFVNCSLRTMAPENNRHLRPCYPDAVSTCSSNWKDDFIREKCESYSAVILADEKTKKYKNPHCAICNGFDVMDLDCIYLLRRSLDTKPANIACLFTVGNCTCENKVLDPAFRKCRQLTCGLPFLELKDGKCVRKS